MNGNAMTRRRRLLWVVGAGILAIVGPVLAWTMYPWPGVTERNYERIQMGLAYEEVVAILGGPPTNGVLPDLADEDDTLFFVGRKRGPYWSNDDEGISIYLGFRRGRVTGKSIHHVSEEVMRVIRLDLLTRLRRRFGW